MLHLSFVCFDSLQTSQHFFFHQTGLSIFEDKASCSKTLGSAPGEARTCNSLISSQALYHWAPNLSLCCRAMVCSHLYPHSPSQGLVGMSLFPYFPEWNERISVIGPVKQTFWAWNCDFFPYIYQLVLTSKEPSHWDSSFEYSQMILIVTLLIGGHGCQIVQKFTFNFLKIWHFIQIIFRKSAFPLSPFSLHWT